MAKIVYFSTAYSPHDHRFLSALAQTEHKIYFVQLEKADNSSLPAEIELVDWDGGARDFRWSDLPRYTSSLKRILAKIRPDILHAGPIQTVGLLAVLSQFRPILMMSWGFDLMEDVHKNFWWERVTHYVLRRSTFFISDAQVTRNKAVQYGMNPARTIVFPWGVDLNRFSPRNTPRPTRDEFILFCNRSWEPRYGVDVLAEAFVLVAQRKPNTRLHLLAGGSQENTIRRILAKGGALNQVRFKGYIPQKELPRHYRQADVYISPSHVDGSSVSLLEAMACGLPCLVSDIPANREWVSEGLNGWIFADGNAKILAETILRVAENRDTLSEIGAHARQKAEERADWQKNFQKLLEAYRLTAQLT
jgi:glycosyltransferase involved in cell wall biosynthesis